MEAEPDGPALPEALVEYSRARDAMFKKTDTRIAPWYIVRSDDKRTARLNTIAHLLSAIPYKKVPEKAVKLPKRSSKDAYETMRRSRAGVSCASATEVRLLYGLTSRGILRREVVELIARRSVLMSLGDRFHHVRIVVRK